MRHVGRAGGQDNGMHTPSHVHTHTLPQPAPRLDQARAHAAQCAQHVATRLSAQPPKQCGPARGGDPQSRVRHLGLAVADDAIEIQHKHVGRPCRDRTPRCGSALSPPPPPAAKAPLLNLRRGALGTHSPRRLEHRRGCCCSGRGGAGDRASTWSRQGEEHASCAPPGTLQRVCGSVAMGRATKSVQQAQELVGAAAPRGRSRRRMPATPHFAQVTNAGACYQLGRGYEKGGQRSSAEGCVRGHYMSKSAAAAAAAARAPRSAVDADAAAPLVAPLTTGVGAGAAFELNTKPRMVSLRTSLSVTKLQCAGGGGSKPGHNATRRAPRHLWLTWRAGRC